MPAINLDSLDLAALRRLTAALVDIGRRYSLGHFGQGQETQLLERGQKALRELLAEIKRLGLPLNFKRDDLQGADNVRVAVEKILFAADNLNCWDPFQSTMHMVLLGDSLAELKAALDSLDTDTELADQYVTLDQAAAFVNRSKKTLERAMNKSNSDAPPPDVEGGGGRPHEWRWSVLRPWLEKTYGKKLPERFPQLRAAT
jgi:hypothetical protein